MLIKAAPPMIAGAWSMAVALCQQYEYIYSRNKRVGVDSH